MLRRCSIALSNRHATPILISHTLLACVHTYRDLQMHPTVFGEDGFPKYDSTRRQVRSKALLRTYVSTPVHTRVMVTVHTYKHHLPCTSIGTKLSNIPAGNLQFMKLPRCLVHFTYYTELVYLYDYINVYVYMIIIRGNWYYYWNSLHTRYINLSHLDRYPSSTFPLHLRGVFSYYLSAYRSALLLDWLVGAWRPPPHKPLAMTVWPTGHSLYMYCGIYCFQSTFFNSSPTWRAT